MLCLYCFLKFSQLSCEVLCYILLYKEKVLTKALLTCWQHLSGGTSLLKPSVQARPVCWLSCHEFCSGLYLACFATFLVFLLSSLSVAPYFGRWRSCALPPGLWAWVSNLLFSASSILFLVCFFTSSTWIVTNNLYSLWSWLKKETEFFFPIYSFSCFKNFFIKIKFRYHVTHQLRPTN